jgi:hypothetical protein
MTVEDDIEIFDETIAAIARDFAANPFQYGNENTVVPELFHRLRLRLRREYLPVDYRNDYADPANHWRVRVLADRVSDEGNASRVRSEVSFIENEERWTFNRVTDGEPQTTHKQFDIAFVASDSPLIMQSKEEGPGNYLDVTNRLSVLCEVKHSKNESSNFYSPKKGARDVRALSQYPGEVGKRVFLFVDWWPCYENGNERYEKHEPRLRENVVDLRHPVETVYLDRNGRVERTRYLAESSVTNTTNEEIYD